jgi:hypothetical protein
VIHGSPIAATFHGWLAASPGAVPADLPHRLAIVRRPDGGWDDFVRLAPNRDLPAFVAHALPSGHGLDLAACSAAHHFGAMHGIVGDRIVDGQCGERPELMAARRRLLDAWLARLAQGLGGGDARRIVGRALRAWRRGLDRERRLLATGSASWDAYADAVVLRLRWGSATAVAMLAAGGAPVAARALQATYDRFVLALQILDDHEDRAEDAHCRGATFAGLAELVEGPRAVAGVLVAGAAARAFEGGLYQLGAWLQRFAGLLVQLARTHA